MIKVQILANLAINTTQKLIFRNELISNIVLFGWENRLILHPLHNA